jgi:predicted PurR-regulated permease PerM
MVEKTAPRLSVSKIVDFGLPVLLLALLIALCIQLLFPFVGLLLWTIILAICFYPLHARFTARGWSARRSAIVIGTFLAAFILVPTAIAATSAASAIPDFVGTVQSGEKQLPSPPDRIKDLPIVGDRAHAIWTQASNDWPGFRQRFGPQLTTFTRWLLKQAAGTFVALMLLLVAVILAAITLAYSTPVREFTARIFARITGSHASGLHYMAVVGATVRSVANGVIGVAFVQALLVGIGLFAVGMPGAGLLSLLAMVLGVLQVPVIIVTLPAIVWAFSVKSVTVAVVFTIWSILAGLSDAALKPLMIGRGLEVPMPVILLGVIGGVMAYGLVGLFIGAVLLAVGYVLFREWLEASEIESPAPGKRRQTKLQAAE